MKKIGIIGAAGFTGQELMRLLSKHSQVKLIYLTSSEYSGQKVIEVFRSLDCESLKNAVFCQHPKKLADIPSLDFVFTATPDAVSLTLIPLFIQKNMRVIDIAGIFRLKDKKNIQEVYGLNHDQPQLLQEAVYGLPEWNAKKITTARLVANPGCYPTSVLLPLLAIQEFLSEFEFPIFIDSKSGTSGAGGRKEKDSLSYSGVNENFRAYKIERHQHQPEIEFYAKSFLNQTSKASENLKIRFIPHLLPLERGIFSTVYLKRKTEKNSFDFNKLQKTCQNFANKHQFIRFYTNPNHIEIKKTAYSNFCDFSYYWDDEYQTLILVSTIDNLLKGAAGQAVQNFNLMIGAKQDEGLQ